MDLNRRFDTLQKLIESFNTGDVLDSKNLYDLNLHISELQDDRKEIGKQAMETMQELLPPEDWGENMDCDCLQQNICELSGHTF